MSLIRKIVTKMTIPAVVLAAAGALAFFLQTAKLPAGLWNDAFAKEGESARPEIVLQTGHSSKVDAVVFSPDGRWIATGSFDNTIKIWDAETGRELRSLNGHTGAVRALAWSPDGRLLASGGGDRTVRIWDVASGREMERFEVTDSLLEAVAFSPDGQKLAAGPGNTIIVWDVATGNQVRLSEHSSPVTALTFSRDGLFLASGDAKGSIKVWDLVKAKRLKNLTGHTDRIEALVFNQTGDGLASGGDDRTVRLWKTASGRQSAESPGHTGKIMALRFSPDGQLTSADSNCAVKTWDTINKREAKSLTAKVGPDFTEGTVGSAVFSSDGRFLATGNGDRTASLYSAETGEKLQTLENRTTGLRAVAFSADRSWLAFGAADNSVKLWDLRTGQSLPPLIGHGGYVTSVAFTPDNSRLISASVDHTIKIWDVVSEKLLATLTGHKSYVNFIAVSKGGKFLVSASSDKTVGIWNLETNRLIRFMPGHTDDVTSVAVSPDEKLIASGSADKSIRIWDAVTGALVRTITGNPSEVDAVGFSPDGKYLASGGADKVVRIWEPSTGILVKTITGHAGKIRAVVFGPDGGELASASEDKTVRIWSVPDGREKRVLSGHYAAVSSLAFATDGGWLASASEDGSVNIWGSGGDAPASTLVSLKTAGDWVVVTPQGFFDGSPDAWQQLLWRFRDDSFSFSPVEVFFDEFYQPGLLGRILGRRSMPADKNIAARDRRQPQLRISLTDARKGEDSIKERVVKVKIQVWEAGPDIGFSAGSGARDVRLFRNGSLVYYWGGNVVENGRSAVLEAEIPIVEGQNVLTAYAFNNDNIKSTDAKIVLNGAAGLGRKGKTRIITIGVGEYANAAFNLDFVASDATNFGSLLKAKQVELDTGVAVEVTQLLDKDATKANILGVLNRLGESEKSGAQPEDTVIVYFSGHGVSRGDRFYMVPYDLGYTGPPVQTLTEESYKTVLDTIMRNSISDIDLEGAFRRIDAKNLVLIIDACESGRTLRAEDERQGPMNSKGLAQFAYEKGMYILTATQDAENAYVSRNLERSYLNFALLEEGLKAGGADNNPADGKLVLREWFDYASRRVPVLRDEVTKGLSSPEESKDLKESDAKPRGNRPPSEQRPRAFYRRQAELQPVVIARFDSGRSAVK